MRRKPVRQEIMLCAGTVTFLRNEQTAVPFGRIRSADGDTLTFDRSSGSSPGSMARIDQHVLFTVSSRARQQACDVRPISSERDAEILFRAYSHASRSGRDHPAWRRAAKRFAELVHHGLQSQILCDGLPQQTLQKRLRDLQRFLRHLDSTEKAAVINAVLESCSAEALFEAWMLDLTCLSSKLVSVVGSNWRLLPPQDRTRLLTNCLAMGLLTELVTVLRSLPLQDFAVALAELSSICGKDTEVARRVVQEILDSADSSQMTALWLDDLLSELPWNRIEESIPNLNGQSQQRCFKKLFEAIRLGAVAPGVDELLSAKWTDLSTSVVCEILSAHRRREDVDDCAVYAAVAIHVTTPEQALELNGYFDICEGRAYFVENPVSAEVLEILEELSSAKDPNFRAGLETRRDAPPNFVVFCEGRQALREGQPVLDPKFSKPYWWCGNQRCVAPCVRKQLKSDWRDYTLSDFLAILGIDYSLPSYQKLLGTLNRVNAVMSHMECRDCGHVLRPNKKSESRYAFHRMTRFSCRNAECENREVVYISHCLNPRCGNIIDSRDCVKCAPAGFDQRHCGWYVCDYCLSCCSTEKIGRRLSIYAETGQAYQCHKEGHWDRREICCCKCGSVMRRAESGRSTRLVLSCPECDQQLSVDEINAEHDFQRLSSLRFHKIIEDAFPWPSNQRGD